ncbi:MAG: damage-inducible protein DinB [Proteobacteria bacterium]|nr:MAG: damage-inducible protein DinB [Pseudomonadota bacterium]
MNPTATSTPQVISKDELLAHFQGHRSLTRRVIEMFPEEDFFSFSIGGMRTAAQLTSELLSIAGPALNAITKRSPEPYLELEVSGSKADFLSRWDRSTQVINEAWEKISVEEFAENFNLFGQYEFPIIQNVLYFIDNEVHHRGQMFVYLRALGLEPPFFWDRN